MTFFPSIQYALLHNPEFQLDGGLIGTTQGTHLSGCHRYTVFECRWPDLLHSAATTSMIVLVLASVFILIYEVKVDLGTFGGVFEYRAIFWISTGPCRRCGRDRNLQKYPPVWSQLRQCSAILPPKQKMRFLYGVARKRDSLSQRPLKISDRVIGHTAADLANYDSRVNDPRSVSIPEKMASPGGFEPPLPP